MADQSPLLPLLLSSLAGLSTLLGAIIVFLFKPKDNRLITFSLGFSAGVMLTVSFTDLLPSAEQTLSKFKGEYLGVTLSIIFLLIGVAMAYLIDKFIPSDEDNASSNKKSNSKELYNLGIVSMIAIMLHNFPEGIATFMSSYHSISLGIYITIAIALHNIPEGISIAVPIYYSTGSKYKAIKYAFISGIAEPLGALLTFLFLKPFINDLFLGIIFALVAGIMLYLSLIELLPTARKYNHTKIYLYSIFLGVSVMLISHMLPH
ncbi:MAG: zinc transporter ZupT [Clostridium sp.]